jgi:nucleoside 2-deoxyribosyltransferase
MTSSRKIYLAGSWKNAETILRLQDLLISEGHKVDCFASTNTGRTSFNWAELTQALGAKTREDAEIILKDMDAIDLLAFARVQKAFAEDKKWLDWCNIVILILPSGKSAHLEAGYAKGQGKEMIIFGDFIKGDRDVMYGFANGLFRECELDKMLEYLRR